MENSKIYNFLQWKGKATGRKGMGMELALLVLFVVFACSILLVSSAMLGKSNLNDRKDQMIERFALDMLAEKAWAGQTIESEDYAVYQRVNNEWVPLNGGPAVDAAVSEGAAYLITDKESGQVKLTVTWDGNKKITAWEYG